MKRRKKHDEPATTALPPIEYEAPPRMEEVDIDRILLTYTPEENPNQMPPEKFEGLKASVARNDFLQPVLLREEEDGALVMVDGHHRYDAAKAIGRTTLSAVIVRGVDAHRSHLLGLGLNRYRGDAVLARAADILQHVNLNTDVTFEDMQITTGFDDKELRALLERHAEPEVELELPDDSALNDDTAPPKPFVLEIRFERKEDFQLARRKLKKAAGTSGDFGIGLLNVLGEVDHE